MYRAIEFFEGLKVKLAHVKLIPVHKEFPLEGRSKTRLEGTAKFSDEFERYPTT